MLAAADSRLHRLLRPFRRRQTQTRELTTGEPGSASTSPRQAELSRAAAAEGEEDGRAQLISEIAGKIWKAIRGRPRWEESLLHDLSARYPQSLLFHPSCIREVLRRQSSDPVLSLRYFLWASSSSSSAAADPAASTAVFDGLVAARAWGAAMLAIRSTKCRPKSQSLRFFLDQLCAERAFEEALEAAILLKSELGFTPSAPFWNAALGGSLRVGRPDLTWRFYEKMTQWGVAGDASTAGSLAGALCAEKRLSEAHRLLRGLARDGVSPDAVFFTRLVAGLAGEGSYGEMSEVLHLMIAAGRPPDVFIYQAIIHGLCRNGLGTEGLRIFEELKLRGYSPDVPTYTAMIDGLCKMGRTEEALGLWEEMIGKGLRPNRYTYNVLVDHHWKKGAAAAALRLHEEMLSSGISENTVTCNTMIAGLCSQGMTAAALAMFREMPAKGVHRDVISYNTMIQGLAGGGKIAEAVGIYRDLLAAGLRPGGETCDPLIRALCNAGDLPAAGDLLEEMARRKVEPLSRSYDCIIRGFCDAGNADEGMRWLARTFSAGNTPEEETFNRLLVCLCAGDRLDDALLVLNKMVTVARRHLGGPICGLLIETLCGKNPPLVDECMNKILASDP